MEKMKLYLLTRTDECGLDDYDSIMVAAKSKEDAKTISPDDDLYSWTTPSNIVVEYLGETDKPRGVIAASFNAE